MKRLLGLLAALLIPAMALAAPVPYINAPTSSYYEYGNLLVGNINASSPINAAPCYVTGSAGASTCNGAQVIITTEALSTVANTTYTETLTDSSITAGSRIICMAGYGTGTATAGNPVCGIGVPAAGSATLLIRNASASALNGSIQIYAFVVN